MLVIRRILCAIVGVLATSAIAVAGAGADTSVARGTIVLHPGQSKRVGSYTVVCTTRPIKRTTARIVLHPGYQVTVRGTRIRCAPTPKPTPAPVPTPTPAPPQVGARSNPFPLGTRAADSTWAITVNTTTFDAWPAIQAANMFNEPPPPGAQDVMANLTISYLGPGSTTLTPLMIDLGVVGQSNVEYRHFVNSCGVPPSPREIDYSTVFSGATIQLNLCWQVAAVDVPTVQFVYDDRSWFALK